MQLKHVLRRLAAKPSFTAITLITLAVGIGANSAIFSIVNGVLLKPLPYPESHRLVAVWQTAPGIGIPEINASPATYYTYRDENKTFVDIGLWRGEGATVTGVAEPEQVQCLAVTDGILPVLGVRPVIGRWFTAKDDSPGSPETVMLTYGYWQRRFGGSPSVLGRRIMVDSKAHEVIGVMPEDFRFTSRRAALIVPLRLNRSEVFIGNFSYQSLARLKPGVTLEQASSDVARMLPMMTRKFQPPPGMSMKMLEQARFGPNLRLLEKDVIGDVGKTLWLLMATVGMVLLIACANVANLMLVRAEGRQHELAIRSALGASKGRIARELLLESVVLGLFGGIAGSALAYAALQLLVKLSPANLPRLEEIGIDSTVLAFTFVLSLAAGLIFGLLPVFKYAGPRPSAALREGGRSISDGRERHRARNILVIAQVALALVLLISSGLMIRTLQAMQHVAPGFTDPDSVQTLRVSIPDAQVPDAERVARMHESILQKIAALPGVSSVAITNSVTMDGNDNNDPIFPEDHPYSESQLPPIRRWKFISPGYFQTMGNRLLAGRDLTWSDIFEKRPVVLLSENLAREYWRDPGAAIGKRVREKPNGDWREVIGVVGEERDNGVDRKAPTIAYWPFLAKNIWDMKLRIERSPVYVVRTARAGSPAFLKEAQRAVWSVNPDLPVAGVRTLREIYDRSMARTSFTLLMLTIAAVMALLLGLVGIYGVISYSVSQRTREIGIRMALGAPETTVRKMFLRDGLVLTAIGVALGLVVAMAATRAMAALLFEVSPLDPLTYSAVPLILMAAALLATYVPARKATGVAVVQALRSE